jgi:hypothetical protein
LAAAFALYGLLLAAAATALGSVPSVLVVLLVAGTGACGPLLTGGLSSRLAGIAGNRSQAQRRAEGWDSVSYGIGGAAGPAGVAALAALAGPLTAMLALAAAAVAAAALTLTLPNPEPARPASERVLSVRAALRLMATYGPLRGEPEALTARSVALMAIALALCALAPGYPLALAALALAGIANAPFFAATLAARSRYSPPDARAQVFVTLAGVKVAMASVGTAIAGATIGLGARPLLAAGTALTLTGAVAAAIDRRRSDTPRPIARAIA